MHRSVASCSCNPSWCLQRHTPKPTDADIKIKKYGKSTVYVRVFSGFATEVSGRQGLALAHRATHAGLQHKFGSPALHHPACIPPACWHGHLWQLCVRRWVHSTSTAQPYRTSTIPDLLHGYYAGPRCPAVQSTILQNMHSLHEDLKDDDQDFDTKVGHNCTVPSNAP